MYRSQIKFKPSCYGEGQKWPGILINKFKYLYHTLNDNKIWNKNLEQILILINNIRFVRIKFYTVCKSSRFCAVQSNIGESVSLLLGYLNNADDFKTILSQFKRTFWQRR